MSTDIYTQDLEMDKNFLLYFFSMECWALSSRNFKGSNEAIEVCIFDCIKEAIV